MAQVTLNANQTIKANVKENVRAEYGMEIAGRWDDAPDNWNIDKTYVIEHSFDNSPVPKGAVLKSVNIRFYAQVTPGSPDINLGWAFRGGALNRAFDAKNTMGFVPWGIDTRYGDLTKGKPLTGYNWYTLPLVRRYDRKTYFLDAIQYGVMVDFRVYARLENYWTDDWLEGDDNGFYIYTAYSSNKPQLIVTYDAPIITVSPGFTNGLFIAKNLPKSISWSMGWQTNDEMFSTPEQTKATIQCKDSAGTKTITVSGSAKTATIPAGTFTQNTGQIKIILDSTGGGHAESAWINVNTLDETGSAIAVSPRGVRVDGDAAQVFSWTYDVSTGTPQTKAELQISYNGGGSWQALATAEGDVRQTTIPAGTLEAGAAAWRVRCLNSDGSPGEYSEAAYIIVRKNPTAPTYVTSNARPRLLVEWASSGQQGYQLQVEQAGRIAYDSGTVFGLDKQLQLPDFLPDGPYIARVRIIDKQGLWSSWTSISGTIANQPGEEITASTKSVLYGAQISWNTNGQYTAFYILRDGVPVGKADAAVRSWTDWNTNGKHHYILRGVKGDGFYTDAQPVVGVTQVKFGTICELETHNWMLLKLHEGGPFVHSESRSQTVEYAWYAGRSKPVAYPTAWESITHTVEYTLKDRDQWQKLNALAGKTVLYKDYRGALIVGTLDSIDTEHTKRINFSLQITETDWQEAIPYD